MMLREFPLLIVFFSHHANTAAHFLHTRVTWNETTSLQFSEQCFVSLTTKMNLNLNATDEKQEI